VFILSNLNMAYYKILSFFPPYDTHWRLGNRAYEATALVCNSCGQTGLDG
jgi:hypothetical protein